MTRRLACLALLATAASAETPMTTLRIEVKSQSDKVVERAAVRVKFLEGRNYMKLGRKTATSYELKTNQEGVARIPPIPQGKILVQVIAKGYQTFGQTFQVDETERTIEVKLNPPQQSYSAHQ